MADHRTQRISEEVKKELSNIINNELKDPRLSQFITVTNVDVTRDLRYAKAFISIMGTEEEKSNTIKALKSASGFIRREVSNRMDLRYTPEFSFELDNSIEYGINISKMIKDINIPNEE